MRRAPSWSPEASPATMAMWFAPPPTALADESALRAREKIEQRRHLRAVGGLHRKRALRLLQAQPGAVQRAVGALDAGDGLGPEAAPAQALAVDAVGPGHVARSHDVGQQVLRQVGAHAGEAVRADVHELVYQGGRAQNGPVAHVHVARELAGIGEDRLAADLAVVREVHVRHDPVVVAHARHARVARRAAVDGDVFAYRVAVADLHGRVFAAIFLVLRRRADGGELIDAVVAADAHAAIEDHVRPDPAALADLDLFAEDRVGADRHPGRDA